jgi:alanyl aminopeptidase
VLDALGTLVGDAERSVATAPMGVLEFARDHLLSDAERPALERHARRLYMPILQELGWTPVPGEDGERKLLRAEVVGFLADVARAPAVRDRAARLGRAWLGLAGEGAEQPAEDLRAIAVRIAVEDGDDATFDTALARLGATVDPVERNFLLWALGSVRDARSGRALALALDPMLKVSEMLAIPRHQMADDRTREPAWEWVEKSFDAVAARLSKQAAGAVPGLAASFCSGAAASRVEAFFAPRIGALTGGPRRLAETLEAVRLCAARAQTHQDGARAYYAK